MTVQTVIATVLASGATYRALGEETDVRRDDARLLARRAGLRSQHRPPGPRNYPAGEKS